VPANEDTPTDTMRDAFESWLKSHEPGVHRESLDADFWSYQPPGRMSATFEGKLLPGPFLSITKALDIVLKPPIAGAVAPQTGDLRLAPLIDWWKQIIAEGISVLSSFGVSRARLGLTVVEFALMGPIFFLLLLGSLDLGRAVYIYNSISDAAREGARAAVPAQTPRASNGDIMDATAAVLH